MKLIIVVAGFALLMAGCSILDPEKLAKDNASVCAKIEGGYFSQGGYGYLGRTNEPGSTIQVNESGCLIKHGHQSAEQNEKGGKVMRGAVTP